MSDLDVLRYVVPTRTLQAPDRQHNLHSPSNPIGAAHLPLRALTCHLLSLSSCMISSQAGNDGFSIVSDGEKCAADMMHEFGTACMKRPHGEG